MKCINSVLKMYLAEITTSEPAEDMRVVGRALLIAGLIGLFMVGSHIEGILLSVLALFLLLEANRRIR